MRALSQCSAADSLSSWDIPEVSTLCARERYSDYVLQERAMLPLERHRLIVELLGQHGVMRVNE
ncbi:hypothetical protein, partial [Klebsiella pneumoniae]|uniref:hypothetical protein n=1 Tax=Klebsiella pneumoniae TaxID=573 RepID=UPI001C627383